MRMGTKENCAITRHLLDHSTAPMQAVILWSTLMMEMQFNGEIVHSFQRLAEVAEVELSTVNSTMTELIAHDVIFRVASDAGGSRYFMNPWAANYLDEPELSAALDAAPPLTTLIEADSVKPPRKRRTSPPKKP